MTDYVISTNDGMVYTSASFVQEEPIVDDEPFLSVEGALVLGLVIGILLGFIFGRRQ